MEVDADGDYNMLVKSSERSNRKKEDMLEQCVHESDELEEVDEPIESLYDSDTGVPQGNNSVPQGINHGEVIPRGMATNWAIEDEDVNVKHGQRLLGNVIVGVNDSKRHPSYRKHASKNVNVTGEHGNEKLKQTLSGVYDTHDSQGNKRVHGIKQQASKVQSVRNDSSRNKRYQIISDSDVESDSVVSELEDKNAEMTTEGSDGTVFNGNTLNEREDCEEQDGDTNGNKLEIIQDSEEEEEEESRDDKRRIIQDKRLSKQTETISNLIGARSSLRDCINEGDKKLIDSQLKHIHEASGSHRHLLGSTDAPSPGLLEKFAKIQSKVGRWINNSDLRGVKANAERELEDYETYEKSGRGRSLKAKARIATCRRHPGDENVSEDGDDEDGDDHACTTMNRNNPSRIVMYRSSDENMDDGDVSEDDYYSIADEKKRDEVPRAEDFICIGTEQSNKHKFENHLRDRGYKGSSDKFDDKQGGEHQSRNHQYQMFEEDGANYDDGVDSPAIERDGVTMKGKRKEDNPAIERDGVTMKANRKEGTYEYTQMICLSDDDCDTFARDKLAVMEIPSSDDELAERDEGCSVSGRECQSRRSVQDEARVLGDRILYDNGCHGRVSRYVIVRFHEIMKGHSSILIEKDCPVFVLSVFASFYSGLCVCFIPVLSLPCFCLYVNSHCHVPL